jgi:hypothetical protein
MVQYYPNYSCSEVGEQMAISEWWTQDPAQRYWMEITDRKDLGGSFGRGRR